ncbi:hypothetical protein EVAR_16477_1 [Eumeta japonica]|uniref:Uncharacterized protein n=1 Tax=Eumeta variegata TaxID=151549 RepID=A0A4C1UKE3_EUMVA|nr:hypothetical protein EVAR_16477_1 [Eumeta japonica]
MTGAMVSEPFLDSTLCTSSSTTARRDAIRSAISTLGHGGVYNSLSVRFDEPPDILTSIKQKWKTGLRAGLSRSSRGPRRVMDEAAMRMRARPGGSPMRSTTDDSTCSPKHGESDIKIRPDFVRNGIVTGNGIEIANETRRRIESPDREDSYGELDRGYNPPRDQN